MILKIFSGRVEETWAGEVHSGGTEVSERAMAVVEARTRTRRAPEPRKKREMA